MRRLLLVWLCVCSFAVQAQQLPDWVSPEGLNDPHLGQVLDTANGIWLTPAMLVESLASAPHVLVGEKHDNPDHHRLQLWLLQKLHSNRSQGALLMEMIDPSQQAAADELQGRADNDDTVLHDKLDWSPGWDWNLYGPLVKWGLANPERLLGANLTKEEMRAIYQEPALETDVYSTEALQLLNETIATAHCGKMPEDQLPAMLAIQQGRDQRMAQQLLEAPTPALLLAGSYHVRKDLGVPLYWPADGPAVPLVVILVEAGAPLPDRTQADFIWLTAALPETDYCAQWE
ncbi:ChaN family lipoprotein [Halopseudomonas salina]|uniref:Haem-binding uptake Tiki superfamily ChaN domain-containing protein n=1 Tax=Halopseudomonas salina TaxID=1323744 RepID=A0ABQ1PZ11_9GAMM|nr:ChaN family lipoprotein [Halopseudomonas salina]GGD08126.1 hypothetical protein GCM10007418_28970 [Halopseudomonas salina]